MMVLLGDDEVLDIRMVTTQCGHHRATSRARRKDGAAHRIPDVHEGHRARGNAPGRMSLTPGRTQGRKIIADATALLHRQRPFPEVLEDAVDAVLQAPHHEAVEQCDASPGPSPGQDAPAWEEAKTLKHRTKPSLPCSLVV